MSGYASHPSPTKATLLREGAIDLEIGTVGASAPEIRSQLLFRDRFVGAARHDHPLFAEPITAQRYAACDHTPTLQLSDGSFISETAAVVRFAA